MGGADMKPMVTRVRVGPGAETKYGPTTEYAEGVYVDTLADGRIAVLLDAPGFEDHPLAKWPASLDLEPGWDFAIGLSAIADRGIVVEIPRPN